MIIIGVTGNSGAGKTTVATIMKNNLGAVLINADTIAKTLMKPGEEYYNDILKLFEGENLLQKKEKYKDRIDRAKLSKLIFENEEARKQMNKLTFKYVGQEMKKIIMENKNADYIILDVPLLYEGGFEKICNYVIAVIADEETKIARIHERDKIQNNDAKNRIRTQISDEFLKENANFVIENNASNKFINLVNQTIRVLHQIKDEKK